MIGLGFTRRSIERPFLGVVGGFELELEIPTAAGAAPGEAEEYAVASTGAEKIRSEAVGRSSVLIKSIMSTLGPFNCSRWASASYPGLIGNG